MEYKNSRRMILINRKEYTFEEFRDKSVLAEYLGVAHETITSWFRVQENGKKPKTKLYNNMEIICIDGEYTRKNKNHGNLRSSRSSTS